MSTGRRIAHYEIRELLGEGGIGQVHAAFDTVLGREVAIKSLRPELINDSSFVERFRTEATNLARLNHPNITTLYALLPEGRNLYMVMELVRGRTLEAIIQERGSPFAVQEALAIIGQAVDGLSYAHAMGVIHRDIKPANLIITDAGLLKIMDFGIARVQGSQRLTRDGSIVGTLAYMAPEQLRAEEVDARTDLYSLAIVLYEMLSGSVPFTAASDYELMRAQIHTPPERLVHQAQGVDPQVDKAVMRALAKRPADRYPTVAAFKEALGSSLSRTDAVSIVQKATRLISAAALPDSVRSTVSAMSAPVRKSSIPMWVRGVAIGAAAAVVVAAAVVLLIGPGPARRAISPPAAIAVAPPPAASSPASAVPKTVQQTSAPAAAAPNPFFPTARKSTASADAPAAASPAASAAPALAPARPRPDGSASPPFQVAAEPSVARPAARVAEATMSQPAAVPSEQRAEKPATVTMVAPATMAAVPEPRVVAPPAAPPPPATAEQRAPVPSASEERTTADQQAVAPSSPEPQAPAATSTAARPSAEPAPPAPSPDAGVVAPAPGRNVPAGGSVPTATAAPPSPSPDAGGAATVPGRSVPAGGSVPMATAPPPSPSPEVGGVATVPSVPAGGSVPTTAPAAPAAPDAPASRVTFAEVKAAYDLKDYPRTRELAEPLAASGDPDALFIMGRLYHIGGGMRKDEEKAVEWYQKAADRGQATAQYALGMMYENGDGVLVNKRTAAEWYRKAAARGVPRAQYNLGVMFARGEGVDRDTAQAKRWLTEASNSSDQFIADKATEALEELNSDERPSRRRRRR